MTPDFFDWALKAILVGSIAYGVRILSKLQNSTEELNVKVARVIEKISGHEKELDRHEERIRELEKEK